MSDIKLTVLGSPGAGKSALIVRFLTGRYISEYASNSECVYTKQMNVDGRMTSLEIHDPCTQVSKKKLPMGEDLGRADGFLVVYDISRRSSFVFAQNLVCNLREANVRMCRRDAEAGLFLIGNKQDLCHIREVSWEEGQKTALENRCHYYELSAAEQQQEVSTMFTTIVRSIFLQNKMKDKRRPSGSMAKLISNVFGKRRKSV